MIKLRILPQGPTFENSRAMDVITIGRCDEADFKLDDPHVSALHGQLLRRQDNWFYQDMGSTNGSALVHEGKRIVLAGEDAPIALEKGDTIFLGSDENPVILEVISCTYIGAKAASATVLAETRIADNAQLADSLQATGKSIGPFLAFSEQLTRAKKRSEAFSVLGQFASSYLESIQLIGLAEPQPDTASVLLWQAEDTVSPNLPKLDESISSDSISCVELPETGMKAFLSPVISAPGRIMFAVAVLRTQDASDADRDGLALASSLLAQRLAQLETLEQLRATRSQLAAQNRYLRKKADSRAGGEIIGDGPAISALLKKISAVAVSDATVLITGQSGSGKELVAREIHRRSLRHSEIFAALNCGALAEGVLESELFGHAKGAFTGAHKDREGMFEVAHGGTLFLDELGEMSPGLQVKILRVLETGEVTPVGSTRKRKLDVRLLFATNKDLQVEVKEGRFRQDLFFRVNVFPVHVPPLSERKEDISSLVRHFLSLYSRRPGAGASEISNEAIRVLISLDWPGNVRQLANEIRRAMIMAAQDGEIQARHLSRTHDMETRPEISSGLGTLKEQLSLVERQLVGKCLEQVQGNRTKAAAALGITRQALLAKLKKLKIQ